MLLKYIGQTTVTSYVPAAPNNKLNPILDSLKSMERQLDVNNMSQIFSGSTQSTINISPLTALSLFSWCQAWRKLVQPSI